MNGEKLMEMLQRMYDGSCALPCKDATCVQYDDECALRPFADALQSYIAAHSWQPMETAPWQGALRHSRNLGDDWGCIRDESGDCIIRVTLPTYDDAELQAHRRESTDPTQERVDYLLGVLNNPEVRDEG